jgi:hypothetical protein
LGPKGSINPEETFLQLGNAMITYDESGNLHVKNASSGHPTLFIGATGYQGPQGFTGPDGFTGPQGKTGPQGNQGNQGFTGPQGKTGPQGNQGNQGFTGPQGKTGPQGNQGFQGFQGNQGFTGSQGKTGPQGNQGFTGPQGISFNQGITGPYGGLFDLSNNFISTNLFGNLIPDLSSNSVFDSSNVYLIVYKADTQQVLYSNAYNDLLHRIDSLYKFLNGIYPGQVPSSSSFGIK